MYRLSYRNFGTHEAMVINHSVTSGTGVGIRWYELRNAAGQTMPTANPVFIQQGTFAPTQRFSLDGKRRDRQDRRHRRSVTTSRTPSTIVPSIRYAYRGPADPLGTMGNETNALTGLGIQTASLSRWGDYSTI